MKRDARDGRKTDRRGRPYIDLGEFAKGQRLAVYTSMPQKTGDAGRNSDWARLVLIGHKPYLSVNTTAYDARQLDIAGVVLALREKLRALVDCKEATVSHLEAFDAAGEQLGVSIPTDVMSRPGLPVKTRAILEYRVAHPAASYAMIAKAVGSSKVHVCRVLKEYGDPLKGTAGERSVAVPFAFRCRSVCVPSGTQTERRRNDPAQPEIDVSPELDAQNGSKTERRRNDPPLLLTLSYERECNWATPPDGSGRLGLEGQPSDPSALTEEGQTQAEPDTTPARCSGTPTRPAGGLDPGLIREALIAHRVPADIGPAVGLAVARFIEHGEQGLTPAVLGTATNTRLRQTFSEAVDAGWLTEHLSAPKAGTLARSDLGYDLTPRTVAIVEAVVAAMGNVNTAVAVAESAPESEIVAGDENVILVDSGVEISPVIEVATDGEANETTEVDGPDDCELPPDGRAERRRGTG